MVLREEANDFATTVPSPNTWEERHKLFTIVWRYLWTTPKYLIIFDDYLSLVVEWCNHNLIDDEEKIEIGNEEKMNKESVKFQIKRILKEWKHYIC